MISATFPVLFAERPITESPALVRSMASVTLLAPMAVTNEFADHEISPEPAAVCSAVPENASVAPSVTDVPSADTPVGFAAMLRASSKIEGEVQPIS